MRHLRNAKNFFGSYKKNINFSKFLEKPVYAIIGINTVLYLAWRLKGFSQEFLVKHFSFNRFNIRNHRYYTMLTYAFSHFGFFSYLFNSLMTLSLSGYIINTHNKRIFWMLYLGGAIAGGVFMQLFKPQMGYVIPEVGADAAISSILTFYGMCNLRQSVLLFGLFPINIGFLLGLLFFYSLYQPSKKSMGGMIAGIAIYQYAKMIM